MTPNEIDEMLEGWRAARRGLVEDVSLYLVGQDEDDTQAFLHFWNDKMEAEFLALDSSERGIFIWRLINDAMMRQHEIERAAVRGSSRLN
jgi:hypothetical protein